MDEQTWRERAKNHPGVAIHRQFRSGVAPRPRTTITPPPVPRRGLYWRTPGCRWRWRTPGCWWRRRWRWAVTGPSRAPLHQGRAWTRSGAARAAARKANA